MSLLTLSIPLLLGLLNQNPIKPLFYAKNFILNQIPISTQSETQRESLLLENKIKELVQDINPNFKIIKVKAEIIGQSAKIDIDYKYHYDKNISGYRKIGLSNISDETELKKLLLGKFLSPRLEIPPNYKLKTIPNFNIYYSSEFTPEEIKNLINLVELAFKTQCENDPLCNSKESYVITIVFYPSAEEFVANFRVSQTGPPLPIWGVADNVNKVLGMYDPNYSVIAHEICHIRLGSVYNCDIYGPTQLPNWLNEANSTLVEDAEFQQSRMKRSWEINSRERAFVQANKKINSSFPLFRRFIIDNIFMEKGDDYATAHSILKFFIKLGMPRIVIKNNKDLIVASAQAKKKFFDFIVEKNVSFSQLDEQQLKEFKDKKLDFDSLDKMSAEESDNAFDKRIIINEKYRELEQMLVGRLLVKYYNLNLSQAERQWIVWENNIIHSLNRP